MGLFNIDKELSDPEFVEKIYEGDDREFTKFYKKNHDKFFGFFRTNYQEHEHVRFDELYQDTCWKLYNQIMTGKLFVDSKKIYLRAKDGSVNLLKASLETYLISIGKLTYLEKERENVKYVDFDPLENIVHDDNDPNYNLDDIVQPLVNPDISIDPIYDLAFEPDLNDEAKFALVRGIVENMGSPCKEIFTYTYFNETGKKLKGEEIAIKMGYSSADVVKNQRARCQKKFKVAYLNSL